MSRAETQVKGSSFLSVLGAAEDLHGADFGLALRTAVPGEAGEALLYGTVIASGWYPISWYRALLAAAVKVSGDLNFPRVLGRGSIRRDVTGIYRVFFKLLSIDTLVRQSPRFFRMCFTPGEVKIELMDEGRARSRYQGCAGFDQNLWLEQLGCVEELLKLGGAHVVRVKVLAGGGENDDYMEIECSWH